MPLGAALSDAVSELLTEGVAQAVAEAVGQRETELLADSVGVTDELGHCVAALALCAALGVAAKEGVGGALPLTDSEVVTVAHAEPVPEREPLGDSVGDSVPLPLAEAEALTVSDAVPGGEGVMERVPDGV